jgi:hypothetical protein
MGPALPKDYLASGKATLDRTPTYLDAGGRLYDPFYRKCDQEGPQQLSRLFEQTPFPNPESRYPSFFDYEEAVLEWKKQTEAALGDLHIPHLMGRAYPRPRVLQQFVRFHTHATAPDQG